MGRYKTKIPVEEECRICQAYVDGMRTRDMEKYFGHSIHKIRDVLRDYGVPRRNQISVGRMDGFTKKDSKCWSCRRSTTALENQCSWTRCWKPVDGWDADPTVCDRHAGTETTSFFVRSCPLYIPEKRLVWRYEDEMPEL